MSTKYPSFDENDPDFAKRLAFTEEITKQTVASYNTWEALYASLAHQVQCYTRAPDRRMAEMTISLLFSFVLAMEDLPETGDVTEIVTRLNQIMLLHPERTGILIEMVESEGSATSKKEQEASAALALLEVLASAMGRAGAGEPEDAPDTPPTGTRTLH